MAGIGIATVCNSVWRRSTLTERKPPMKQLMMIVVAVALAGCGVETLSTAATGAAIKKQELEAGKKTQERVQQNLDQSMQQVQQRAKEDADR
jgi:hypothetical protein